MFFEHVHIVNTIVFVLRSQTDIIDHKDTNNNYIF